MTATATNGLSVIGGDTVNLVGLGGCLPESAPIIIPLIGHFLYLPWQTIWRASLGTALMEYCEARLCG
jgi:hypothetical protein